MEDAVLLDTFRGLLASRGAAWLQEQLQAALLPPSSPMPGPAVSAGGQQETESAGSRARMPRQRRSRPPSRLSPSPPARRSRRARSPSGDPLELVGGRLVRPPGSSPRRNPAAARDTGEGELSIRAPASSFSSPASRTRSGAAASPVSRSGDAARRQRPRGGQKTKNAARPQGTARASRGRDQTRGGGASPPVLQPAVREGARRRHRPTSSTPLPVAPPTSQPAGPESRRDECPAVSTSRRQPEDESSESGSLSSGGESEVETQQLGSGVAAVPVPGRSQPGELAPLSTLVASPVTLSGAVGLGGQSQGACVQYDWLGPLVTGVKQFLGQLGLPNAAAPSPVTAWVGQANEAVQTDTVAGVGQVEEVTASPKEKAVDPVRLDDAAKGEVYVCFDGPLGAHLKQEIREKIWKDEYVEIFSLLPLEKFNLDRVKLTESKKEEEERRRYRLIPRTFANWLQAFAILASVVGEKAPQNCSALFGYLDSIGEAYRVYGGTAWLRYDEQFRQRKAVRPSIRWDHKDISLWMRLMVAARLPQLPFRAGAGGSSEAQGSSAVVRPGCCWQFNEGQCRFGSTCRFKHECSHCGGNHGASKCFKKQKGGRGELAKQRGDSGEGRGDASTSK